MRVLVDKSAGFCWGVIRTIDIAEKELEKEGKLYCLGEIIHNPVEIKRLEAKGLKTVTHKDMEKLGGATVLIRAHGEPPSTYALARKLNIRLLDATCPVVAKVQERIKKFYDEGYQVVIFGKKEHAEVVGLVGQTNGEAIVIKSTEEANNIKLNQKVVLFSQTTMDKKEYKRVKELLEKKVKELVLSSIEEIAIEFQAKYTICGQVSGREEKIREFAKSNDVILFVAGKHSSNGQVLFSIVKSVNPKSYFLESCEDLNVDWIRGVEKVGITGATSTPQWLMEEIKKKVESISSKNENSFYFIQPSVINESLNYINNI